MDIRKNIKENKPILLDGSMGALLISQGFKGPKLLRVNVDHPEILTEVHRNYLKAGCDVISLNTFNITPESTANCGLSVEEIIEGAIKAGKKAIKEFPNALIALDLGPTGTLLQPVGDQPFEDAYALYKRQIQAAKEEVDLILIETVSDLDEIRAAVQAARDCCDLPFLAAMTFTEKGRTWLGASLEEWAELANELDIDAAGLNCTLTPDAILPLTDKFRTLTDKPVWVQPNRGIPEYVDNKAHYKMSVQDFAAGVMRLYDSGIHIVGGCCGSDAECMEVIRKEIDQRN